MANVTNRAITIDDVSADNMPLEFVKQYLRVDHDFDDLEIMVNIRTAQDYVRNFIKQPDGEPLEDALIMPILTLVAHFYENKSPQMKSTEKLDSIFGSILSLYMKEVI